jgi:hypothetical protein
MENHRQSSEMTIEQVDIENASSTWSGFVYQGKVAIYAVLKYINHFYPDIEEIKRYRLVIEELEDFAILRDGQHFSIHQVKAKPNTKTIGSYNEAILNLLGKLALYESIQEASLHTAVQIKEFTRDDVFKNLEQFNIANKKERLKTYKTLLFQEGKFDQVYPKLKISCNDGIVPMNRVIELKEIKELILDELKTFYSKWEDEKLRDKRAAIENVSYLYSNLTYQIEEMVHKNHEDKGIISIEFEQILNILEHQSLFDFTHSTASSLLLHQLMDNFEEYCICYGLDEKTKPTDVWFKHLNTLKKLPPYEFLKICRKLTPHIAIKHNDKLDIEEYKKLMQPDGVIDSFINGIIQLNPKLEEPAQVNNAYEIHNDGLRYLLTTINQKGPFAHNLIGKGIYENLSRDETMFTMLFEIDFYINSTINNTYTGNVTQIKSNIDPEIITEEDVKQTITSQKTINFIQIDKIKEKLLGV